MSNEFVTSIDRRKFLRLGTLGGVLFAGGCGGGGDGAQPVTTPPAPTGNRALLKKNAEAGRAGATNKKS
jgi:hypothetical protein